MCSSDLVGLQSWLVRAAPDQAESAGGLMVATFQVAIALGAVFGGLLVDHGRTVAENWGETAIAIGRAETAADSDRPLLDCAD